MPQFCTGRFSSIVGLCVPLCRREGFLITPYITPRDLALALIDTVYVYRHSHSSHLLPYAIRVLYPSLHNASQKAASGLYPLQRLETQFYERTSCQNHLGGNKGTSSP